MKHWNRLRLTPLIVLTILLVSCGGKSEEETLLNEYWDSHSTNMPCLNVASFPYTKPNKPPRSTDSLLSEFVAINYVTAESTKTNINHDPQKPKNIVDATRYTLNDIGKPYAFKSFMCYGKFQTVEITKISPSTPTNGKLLKFVDFTYTLTDVAEWAIDHERFGELSDDLFDDLYTMKEPGIGQAVLSQREGQEWKIQRVKIRFNKPSQDPNNPRNVKLQKEWDTNQYNALLAMEVNDTPPGQRAIAYSAFLKRNTTAEYQDTIQQKLYDALQQQRELQQAEKEKLEASLNDLIVAFATAIDAKDAERISQLTVPETAASRAHNSNNFRRKKAGTPVISSYKISGKDDELVQIQTDGSAIYMVRGKLVDGQWLVSGYMAK